MADNGWLEKILARIERKLDDNTAVISEVKESVDCMRWHGWALKLLFGGILTGVVALTVAWIKNGQ